MAKFEEVYYRPNNEYITIENYVHQLHYENIFCPECITAPIHRVCKQNKTPYFASNSKQDHLEDCQHYEDYIPNSRLNKLIKSNLPEDKNRLNFLIKNNLQGAINLLLKKGKRQIKTTSNSLNNETTTNSSTTPNIHKKESISRVNVKRLFGLKDKHLNDFIIVWGKADIEKRDSKFGVQILFKISNSIKFSIFLSQKQVKHSAKLKEFDKNTGFAVFGKLIQKNNYLNLQVHYGQHISILNNE